MTLDNSHISSKQFAIRQFAGQGTLNLKNGSTISTENTDETIRINATGNLTINNDASSILGNVIVDNGGSGYLTLSNSAYFIGRAENLTELTLATNSQWVMQGNSNVGDLHFDGTGVISFAPDSHYHLIVENLSGDGIFHITTDMLGDSLGANNSGDLISITGTSSGLHKIMVDDSSNGSAASNGSESLKVVETADGIAEFELLNTNGAVDIGAYQYILVRGDNLSRAVAENWWLRSTGRRTLSADSSGNILNINYLLNHVENQTLLQRLGELRRLQPSEGNAWGRGYAGKLSSFEDSNFSGFDMNYHGIQIGADKYLSRDFYFGVMMGMAKADVDYEIGNGRAESSHLGIYGTYKSENGWYADAIAKYVYVRNKFDTETGAGFAVQGHGNTSGYSIGVEAGKRFYLQPVQSGFYIEPQAQFTYSHQNGTTIKASNGLQTAIIPLWAE